MHILIIEPYFTGSHQNWAEEYARFSAHKVTILSLPGRFWKWRMHGGAVSLAAQFLALPTPPDLILAGDMLDVSTFLALTRPHSARIPVALYFHENQLTYPWSPTDRDVAAKRDSHYGFINYASALAADAVFFNSQYHLDSFFDALPRFLKHFPDHRGLENIAVLKKKAQVLPLGLDLRRFDAHKTPRAPKTPPLILWNHRWEYDKNPAEFFAALEAVAARGIDFRVAILGENFRNAPAEFERAKQTLGARIVHFGYAQNFADYARWLRRADVLPVTTIHDFFGVSVAQAIYCGCFPLLPRRLTYPALIPSAHHARHIYHSFDDLVARLGKFLASPVPPSPELAAAMTTFDWGTMAARYDAVFSAMAQA